MKVGGSGKSPLKNNQAHLVLSHRLLNAAVTQRWSGPIWEQPDARPAGTPVAITEEPCV